MRGMYGGSWIQLVWCVAEAARAEGHYYYWYAFNGRLMMCPCALTLSLHNGRINEPISHHIDVVHYAMWP